MRAAWRFVCCLFDAHRLELDFQRDWLVCRDCGEVRLTDAEFVAHYGQP